MDLCHFLDALIVVLDSRVGDADVHCLRISDLAKHTHSGQASDYMDSRHFR